jgi:hypothetical protein
MFQRIRNVLVGVSLLACAVPSQGSDVVLLPTRLVLREDSKGAFQDVAAMELRSTASEVANVAFRAHVSRKGVAGCVPVYRIPHGERFELRRTPPRGLEADADPVFHAWAASDEKDSARVSGHWEVRAVRADGSRLRFGMDLGAVRGGVVGRFDPDTDYRFARIPSGRLDGDGLTLEVHHIQDRFEIRVRVEGGSLKGRWRHEDGSEQGEWTAERAAGPPAPQEDELEDLVGWTGPGGTRTWRPRSRPPGPEWSADATSLCRVLKDR